MSSQSTLTKNTASESGLNIFGKSILYIGTRINLLNLLQIIFLPSAAVMAGVTGTRSPAYSLAQPTAVFPSSRACRAAMSACSALPRAVAVLEIEEF